MPLFDVPGWDVPTSPFSEPTSSTSKKRKRPVDEEPEPLDLQKLVHKQKRSDGDGASTTARVKTLGKTLVQKTMDRKRQKKADKLEAKKQSISLPKALMPTDKAQKRRSAATVSNASSSADSSTQSRPAKRVKRTHDDQPAPLEKALPTIPEEATPPKAALTALQKDMKKSLDGARFRLINETLYKSDSKEAHQMMQKDPNMFQEYHRGFRSQVESWPTNPVEHYISVLSKYPPRTTIADLGCGDAAMARSLTPKGLNVLSFDLVSDGVFVVEADICARLPLPGSEPVVREKSTGQGHVVDVAVCALSLMGINWTRCVREAWRILRPDGELKIAEVASRFTDVEEFIGIVSSIGFKLKAKDDGNTHFTLFEFKKIATVGKTDKEWEDITRKGAVLKPCEYKRR
ncbi:Uracil phosphoribosyltransferase [Mycena kentingensis (nom. inval.)]|nr:Uracil phosphoribosyltransferase [Mycena kentingensis (nom. inval.)]